MRGPLDLHVEAHRRSIRDGWTVVPLSGRAPEAVARRQAEAAGADRWVGTRQELDALDAHGDGVVRALLQTSGTTGEPRWVPVTRAMLDAHRVAADRRLGSGPDSVWLAVLPPNHVGGVALVDRCLHDGAGLRALPRFEVEAVRAALPGTTHVSLVPLMLRRLLDAGVPPPSGLRCALVGGDRLDPELARRALDAGWPVFATYGLTEACSQVATATPDEVRADPTTVGRPLDGVSVRILDPDADGWGTLEVAGPTVAGGRVVTDDVGRLDADGRLHVRGRRVERIVTGGETVDARAVEAALLRCPGVREACVVGVADPEWGQRVEAAVVAPGVDAQRVRSWARANLQPHEVPKRVVVVPDLPRTETGKPRRGAVLAQLSGTVPA